MVERNVSAPAGREVGGPDELELVRRLCRLFETLNLMGWVTLEPRGFIQSSARMALKALESDPPNYWAAREALADAEMFAASPEADPVEATVIMAAARLLELWPGDRGPIPDPDDQEDS